jgi:hypothetical protein
MLQAFRLIGFCPSNDVENYNLTSTFIQSNLDVLGDGRFDPDAPCDAMSLGIGFTALQARAGKLEKVEPLVECALRDAGADAPNEADSDIPDSGASDASKDVSAN